MPTTSNVDTRGRGEADGVLYSLWTSEPRRRALLRGVRSSLQDDSTVTLTPVEPDEEEKSEFPFPEDELEPGQALLQVKRGPNAGSTFLLDTDTSTIGRNTESTVFLDDVTVSRAHATFERKGAEWFVRDGSLNGTYVNGEQVDETKLATGDQVQIGRFRLTFFQAGG